MEKFDNIEEYKEYLTKLYMQEEALKNKMSYFDVLSSNMDGTFIGEAFDNPIRIKITKMENPEFAELVNDDELKAEARKRFLEDIKDVNN
jgi:hypothetical protein